MSQTPSTNRTRDLFGGALFTAGIAAAGAQAQPVSFVQHDAPGLPDAVSVDIGDLDADGDLDLAVAGNYDIAWYENTGGSPTGFTQRPVPFDLFETPGRRTSVRIADVDGDGRLDLAATASDSSDSIRKAWWQANDGAGVPAFMGLTGYEFFSYQGSRSFDDFVATDLDDDGDIDALLAGRDGVYWWEAGSGALDAYSPRTLLFDAFCNATAVADIDSDGDLDVVALVGNGSVVWLESDGAAEPSFTVHELQPASTFASGSIEIADAEGDGDLDIFFADSDGVRWLANNGGIDPVFTGHLIGGPFVAGMQTGDFDADGDLDIITARAYGQEIIFFYENDGAAAPTFTEQIVFDGPNDLVRYSGLCAGDLDADGDLDLVVTSDVDDRVIILENTLDPAPLVTAQPASVFLAAPSQATFSVTAVGDPSYQWRHNGLDLADGPEFSGANTPTLLVEGSAATEGEYDCVVTNAFGADASQPAVLGVGNGCTADMALPFGQLDFSDVIEFLSVFGSGCP